jgi:glycerol-3-phosphate acyltransferase PlsY
MAGPLSTLIAYLFGSIPVGYLIVRWMKGLDIRTTGSGSIGATNVMRNLGVAGFVVTFVLDVGKGTAAVLIASRLTAHDSPWVAVAAMVGILGHCYPVWLKFRGGKGVATGVGVFLAISPVPVGLVLGIFVVVLVLSRYVSLSSILATAAFPVLVFLIDHPPWPLLVGAAGGASIVIARHHANIARLLKGTESRVGRKKEEVRSQESGDRSQ